MSIKKDIFVVYDPGVINSEVFITNTSKKFRVSSNPKDMADQIMSIVEAEQIYNVKIHAPYAIASEVKNYINSNNEYINKNIVIEDV
nr:MAG TPA: hypothetical protein [Caudoviricetes sp.]